MKKLLTIALRPTFSAFSACAQNIDASKVPVAVKAAFQKRYPGISAKWEKENSIYEVSFKEKERVTKD